MKTQIYQDKMHVSNLLHEHVKVIWSPTSNKDRKSPASVISSDLPPFHFRASVQWCCPSTGHSCRDDLLLA